MTRFRKSLLSSADVGQPLAFIDVYAIKRGGTEADAEALLTDLQAVVIKHGFDATHLMATASKPASPRVRNVKADAPPNPA